MLSSGLYLYAMAAVTASAIVWSLAGQEESRLPAGWLSWTARLLQHGLLIFASGAAFATANSPKSRHRPLMLDHATRTHVASTATAASTTTQQPQRSGGTAGNTVRAGNTPPPPESMLTTAPVSVHTGAAGTGVVLGSVGAHYGVKSTLLGTTVLGLSVSLGLAAGWYVSFYKWCYPPGYTGHTGNISMVVMFYEFQVYSSLRTYQVVCRNGVEETLGTPDCAHPYRLESSVRGEGMGLSWFWGYCER